MVFNVSLHIFLMCDRYVGKIITNYLFTKCNINMGANGSIYFAQTRRRGLLTFDENQKWGNPTNLGPFLVDQALPVTNQDKMGSDGEVTTLSKITGFDWLG
jgi:hypothetical protein